MAALLLPASVAVLGPERNIFKAVRPVVLGRMISGLGPMYALVLALIAANALLIAMLLRLELWLPVQIAILMFCVLSTFSFLGGAAYERRHELGFETWVSPERTAELERERELRRSEQQVTEAYGQVRVGSHTRAWEILQAWLNNRGDAPDDYRRLVGRVASWSDQRYLTRLTEEYVDRLLALRRTGEALDVVARRLGQDPSFRPKSAAATLQIARIAVGGGAAGGARPPRGFSDAFRGRFLRFSGGPLARDIGV